MTDLNFFVGFEQEESEVFSSSNIGADKDDAERLLDEEFCLPKKSNLFDLWDVLLKHTFINWFGFTCRMGYEDNIVFFQSQLKDKFVR